MSTIKLSWSDRARVVSRGIVAAVTGQWEGGERNRYRARPPQFLGSQDASLNFNESAKLISEARSLCQTFPIAGRILRQYANYCIGNLRADWNTGDAAIDQAYEDAWENSMNTMDSRGQHHFVPMTKIVLARHLCDGNIFAQKIDSKGIPQLKLIEGDRVSSDGNYNIDTATMVGGIGISAAERPAFYRVWQRTLYNSFQNKQDIRAAHMLHVFDTDRADAYKGVTAFHSVLNPMRDFKEIFQAETTAVKRNSKTALLIKNILGGVMASDVNLLTRNDSTESTTPNVDVQEIGDGLEQYMHTGEDMKAHESNRPSAAWMGFVDAQITLIAIGLDLHKSFVWSMAGLGGAAARMEIQQAGRTFAAKQDVIERRFLVPVCAWATAKGIANGRLPFHPLWFRFKFQRPAMPSVDLGRDSKAGISENLAGLATATDWFGEDGKDFKVQTEKLAMEQAFRIEMAKKYNVPVESIRQTTPNGNPPGGEQNQQQAAA